MRVFLSAGRELSDGPPFNAAGAWLRTHGNDVYIQSARGGREGLGSDLAFICKHAEAVALLGDWERSRHAQAAKRLAEALDLLVMLLPQQIGRWPCSPAPLSLAGLNRSFDKIAA